MPKRLRGLGIEYARREQEKKVDKEESKRKLDKAPRREKKEDIDV